MHRWIRYENDRFSIGLSVTGQQTLAKRLRYLNYRLLSFSVLFCFFSFLSFVFVSRFHFIRVCNVLFCYPYEGPTTTTHPTHTRHAHVHKCYYVFAVSCRWLSTTRDRKKLIDRQRKQRLVQLNHYYQHV